MEDVGEAFTVALSLLFIIFLFGLVVRTGYGTIEYQGNPINWDSYNGFKAGGSFLVSNYNGEFGLVDEEVAMRLLNRPQDDETELDSCSFNLPGFKDQGGFLEGRKAESTSCSITNRRDAIIRLYTNDSLANYYSIQVGGSE